LTTEVIGLDHVYLTVSDLAASRRWYDAVLIDTLGYRCAESVLAGDPHVHYYNRQFGVSIRPARGSARHDPYAPGLHHLCLRVEDEAAVDTCARTLRQRSIAVTEPALYPQYDADYYAIFLEDPDSIRLEITNFRRRRRERMFDWEHVS
jgi:catechol 2,3-dioxygenase-like lactoylglutathione lyase family enzyme